MSNAYFLFIYTGGNLLANQMLAEKLSDEDACPDQLCSDGEVRDLWRCDRKHVREMEEASEGMPQIYFRIFVREGMHGKIRPWTFGRKKKIARRMTKNHTSKPVLADAG